MVSEIFQVLLSTLWGATFARHLGRPGLAILSLQDAGLPPVGDSSGSSEDLEVVPTGPPPNPPPPISDSPYSSGDSEDLPTPDREKPAKPKPPPTPEAPASPSPPLPENPPPTLTAEEGISAVDFFSHAVPWADWVSLEGRKTRWPSDRSKLEAFADTMAAKAVEADYAEAKSSLWIALMIYQSLGNETKQEAVFGELMRRGRGEKDETGLILALGLQRIFKGDVSGGMILLTSIETASPLAAELIRRYDRLQKKVNALRGTLLLEAYLQEDYEKKIDGAGSVLGRLGNRRRVEELRAERELILPGDRSKEGSAHDGLQAHDGPQALALVEAVLATGKVARLEEALRLVGGELNLDALEPGNPLREKIAALPEATRKKVRVILQDPFVQDLIRASEFEDASFRGQTYLALAESLQDLKEFQGTPFAIYQFLAAGNSDPAVVSGATRRMNALMGRGSFRDRSEITARRFVKMVGSPSGIAAMTAAGMAYRVGRLAVMMGPAWKGEMVVGSLVGTSLEVPAFVFSRRGVESLLSSDASLWNREEIKNELKQAALMFGFAHMAGGIAYGIARPMGRSIAFGDSEIYRWASTAGDRMNPMAGLNPAGRMIFRTVHEPLQFAAFVGAHHLGGRLGFIPQGSGGWMNDLLEGGTNYLQARATASLAGILASPYESLFRLSEISARFRRGVRPPLVDLDAAFPDPAPSPSPEARRAEIEEEILVEWGGESLSPGRVTPTAPKRVVEEGAPGSTFFPPSPTVLERPSGDEASTTLRYNPALLPKDVVRVILKHYTAVTTESLRPTGPVEVKLRFDSATQKILEKGESPSAGQILVMKVTVNPADHTMRFDASRMESFGRFADLHPQYRSLYQIFQDLNGRSVYDAEVSKTPLPGALPSGPLESARPTDPNVTREFPIAEVLLGNSAFFVDRLNAVTRGDMMHQMARLQEGESIQTVRLYPNDYGIFTGIEVLSSSGKTLLKDVPFHVAPDAFVEVRLDEAGGLTGFRMSRLEDQPKGQSAGEHLRIFIEGQAKFHEANAAQYEKLHQALLTGSYPGEPLQLAEGERFQMANLVLDQGGKLMGTVMVSDKTRSFTALPTEVRLGEHSPYRSVIVRLGRDGRPVEILKAADLNFMQKIALKNLMERTSPKR